MQNFRVVVNATLAPRLKPSCAHNNNLPVSREVGRASTEVQAAPSKSRSGRSAVTQPIVDAVCGCVLAVYTCPTAVNQDYIACDLICTECVSHGGAVFSCCRPPIPRGRQKRAIRSRSRVRVYATALRSGFGCAPSRSTFRAKSKAELLSARSSTPRRRPPHSVLFHVREAALSKNFCWWQFFFSPVTDCLVSSRSFKPDLDHATLYVSYYVLKRIHSQA